MIRTWALIVPEPLSIFRAISVPLAHRGECGRRAIVVVIIAALLSLDVRVALLIAWSAPRASC